MVSDAHSGSTCRSILASAWLIALAAAAGGCRRAAPALSPEAALRVQLGIPADAGRVIVFGQAAHLDFDWQDTFDGYYQSYVQDIFLEARGILDAQPRAFYSIAEMDYLQHHFALHPDEAVALTLHADAGALHVVGGGLTSPDTLLPETELLFRDFLEGGRFAEGTLGVRPTSAWLPDSFGHSGTAPDVLAAAGFDSVGMARVDGSPTSLQIIKQPPYGPAPPPGSTAARLWDAGSADFVWQGAGGAAVLAHWMPVRLYCQGDDIDYAGDVLQYAGGHTGTFSDAPVFTDSQIDRYVSELQPLAQTPYLFVPIGCDFQHPKPELLSYVASYNQRQYPKTGTWAIAAPFDLYMRLVSNHRDALPVIQSELSPYFMGFYGSRADIKRLTRDAARPSFEAETFSVALGTEANGARGAAQAALAQLALTNHHDFITGTANDVVYASEQLPLLADAGSAGEAAFEAIASALDRHIAPAPGAYGRILAFNAASTPQSAVLDVSLPDATFPASYATSGGTPVVSETLPSDGGTRLRLWTHDTPPMGWRAVDLFSGTRPGSPPAVSVQLLDANGQPATGGAVTRVVVTNAHVRAQLDGPGSFALTSVQIDGTEALSGPSFIVKDYADQGGLWRLGNEMSGCTLTQSSADDGTDSVAILDQSLLSARVAFVSATATREVALDASDDGLQLALTASAPAATTRTASFSFTTGGQGAMRTSQPAGWVDRPAGGLFTPTYWPAVGWASVGSWAVQLRQSTGVQMDSGGALELMAVRNAQSEQCDFLGGEGSDPGSHRIEWYVTAAASPADAEQRSQRFNRPVRWIRSPLAPGSDGALAPASSLLSVEGEGVVSALKPAQRGAGTIVRVLAMPGPVTVHLGASLQGLSVTRTDALEHDVQSLGSSGETLTVDRATDGSIATFRIAP